MRKATLNYMLDMVIALAFVVSALTGVAFLFMGEGGYQGGRNPAFETSLLGLSRRTWSDLHTWGSLVMIAGVGMHLVLHWKWIVCMTRNLLPFRPRRVSAQETCEVEA